MAAEGTSYGNGDDKIQSNMMDDETVMKEAKQPTYEELFEMVQQQQ